MLLNYWLKNLFRRRPGRAGQSSQRRRDDEFVTLSALRLENRVVLNAAPVVTTEEVVQLLDQTDVAAAGEQYDVSANDPGHSADAGPELAGGGQKDVFSIVQQGQSLDARGDELREAAFETGDVDTTGPANEIVFVDARVADHDLLAAGVRDGVEVVLLDAHRDGLDQIVEHLEDRTDVAAIHVVSHGDSGRLRLGTTELTTENLSARSEQLAALGSSLTDSGDLLFYGCNVGEGARGAAFLDAVAEATGADVAASTDLTGADFLGGDWDLEAAAGVVDVGIAFDAGVTTSYAHVLAGAEYEATGDDEIANENASNTDQTFNSSLASDRVVAGLEDGTGAYVVVWDSAGEGIVARVFEADGTARTGDLLVDTGNVSNPTVLARSGGNFVVGWQGSSTVPLFVREYDAAGDPVTGPVQIDDRSRLDDGFAITEGSNGQLVAAYRDRTTGQVALNAFDMALGSTSKVLFGESGIGIEVAALNNDNFAVVWTNTTQNAAFLRIVDGSGKTVVGTQTVNASAGGHRNPSVATLDDGDVVVAWTTGGNPFDVVVQRFAEDGSRLALDGTPTATPPDTIVNSGTATNNVGLSGSQQNATVTATNDGGFVVLWEGEDQDDTDAFGRFGVFGQRYDALGNTIDLAGDVVAAGLGEFQVHTTTENDQTSPGVAAITNAAGDLGFVAVWTGPTSDAGLDVYARHFAPLPAGPTIFSLGPGGDLIVTDIPANNADATLRVLAGNVELVDGLGGVLDTIDAASVLGDVFVLGLDGDDHLRIETSVIEAGFDVFVDGGDGGNDTVTVVGNGFDSTAVYTPDPLTPGDGVVTVDPDGGGVAEAGTITFTGLEPVNITGMVEATILLPGADDVLEIENGTADGIPGQPAIVVSGTSDGVAIESAHFFGNDSVFVDTSTVDGNDTITVVSADGIASANDSLNIFTGIGTDLVEFAGTSEVANEVQFEGGLFVESGTVEFNPFADVSVIGNGTLDVLADANIRVDINATISVEDGGLFLGAGGNGPGAFDGIFVDGLIQAFGDGDVTLVGTGSAAGTSSDGVEIFTSGFVGTDSGRVVIEGTATGAGSSQGVRHSGAIESLIGAVEILGTGGTAGFSNGGVFLFGGSVSADGDVLIEGFGGSGSFAPGVTLGVRPGTPASIDSFNGTVDIFGFGGPGAGTTDVEIHATTSITAPNVEIGADRLELDGTIVADNVTLSTGAGVDVDLGSTTDLDFDPTLLELSDAELDNIVANQLMIHALNGDITFTEAVDLTGHVDTLTLVTFGAIVDGNANAGPDLAVQNVVFLADGAGAGDPLETAVSNLEANLSAGGLAVVNTGNLTIGGVTPGLNGIETTNGDVSITTSGSLTVAEAIDTAGGDIALVATTNVSLSAGLTSTGGDVAIVADSDGDGGGVVSTDAGGTVNAGSGDITVIAADIGLAGTIAGTGNLLIAQSEIAASLGIGTAAVGSLTIDETELANLVDGFASITLGADGGTGLVDVKASTFADDVTIRGGTISVTGLDAGTNDVTLNASNSILNGGDALTDIVASALELNADLHIASIRFNADTLTVNTSDAASAFLNEVDTVAFENSSAGVLQLESGTFDVPAGVLVDARAVFLNFFDVVLTGAGTVHGEFQAAATAVVRATGDGLTLGESTSTSGVVFFGTLDVGAFHVTLLDQDAARFGNDAVATIDGGTLTAANGIDLRQSATLGGTGVVDASLLVDTLATVTAGVGTLTVGDGTNDGLRLSAGTLDADGNTLVVRDANGFTIGTIDLGDGGTVGTEDPGLEITATTVLGAGTIDNPLVVTNLSPGNSPGIVDVDSLTFAAIGTFDVEIADDNAAGATPGIDHDQVRVTDPAGTVVIGANVTLLLDATGAEIDDGDEYVLIDNQGASPVTGTFAGLAEGAIVSAGGRDFQITYVGGDGNDVVLTALADGGGPLTGDVVFTGTADDDTLVITADGEDSGSYELRTGGVLVDSGLFTSLTSLVFDGLAGDDVLVLVQPDGGFLNPVGGILFNGGENGDGVNPDVPEANGDTLVVNAAPTAPVAADTITHTFVAAGIPAEGDDGTMTIADATISDGSTTITYTGLEPVLDNLDAADRVFTFLGGTETITLVDAAGQLTIDSTLGESVTFANPTESLTINAGDGDDTITIASVDPAFVAALAIDGGAGNDTVSLDANLTLGDPTPGNTGNLDVTAEEILVNASIDTTAANVGNVTLDAARRIAMNAGASVTTAAGAIHFDANAAGIAGNFVGIRLDDAKLLTMSGDISLTGIGGDGNASLNHGIELRGGSTIESLGTGTIALTGTGGVGALPIPGENFQIGVVIAEAGTVIASVDGDITIDGTGGTVLNGVLPQTGSRGVIVQEGAEIRSTGAAAITITGTGHTGQGGSHGVDVRSVGTRISSEFGDIRLTGAGGSGGSNSHGVAVLRGAIVESTGLVEATAATISIDGTGGAGGAGANQNFGILISDGNADVTSVAGTITLEGTGGSGGGGSHAGVVLGPEIAPVMSPGQFVTSTGTASIAITGIGGTGGDENGGVFIGLAGSQVRSAGGEVDVVGAAGGGNSPGVEIRGVTGIAGSAATDITVVAIDGDLLMSFDPLMTNTDAAISTEDGTVSLFGSGDVRVGAVDGNADGDGIAQTVFITADADLSAFVGLGGTVSDGVGAIIDELTTEDANVSANAAVLRAATGIGTNTADGDLDTAVANLAFLNTTSGDVVVTNTGGLMVTEVGGLVSSQNLGGEVRLVATSPITFDADTTAATDLTAQALESGAGTADVDNVTVNTGVTVESLGGDVLFEAGDRIVVSSGAVVRAVTASGDVTFRSGVADADDDGAMTLDGIIAANSTDGVVTLNLGDEQGATQAASGSITAQSLLLLGTGVGGSFDLGASSTNDVAIIAANVGGATSYADATDLEIGSVGATNGITASDDIEVTATGSLVVGEVVTSLGSGHAILAGSDVDVNADVSTSGGDARLIAEGHLDLATGVTVSTTGGDALLAAGFLYQSDGPLLAGDPNADLTMASGSVVDTTGSAGDALLTATNDVYLAVVNAGTPADDATVYVAADANDDGSGRVLDNQDDGAETENETANVTAARLQLRAGSGIGSEDGDFDNDATEIADIDTAVGSVAAATRTGDVHIRNVNPASVDDATFVDEITGRQFVVNLDMTGVVTIDDLLGVSISDETTNPDDAIVLRAVPGDNAHLVVRGPVTNNARGEVRLSAEGNQPGDDLDVLSPITTNGGDVVLLSGRDVNTLEGGAGGGAPVVPMGDPALFDNGPGDGSVSVRVDGYGAFGSVVGAGTTDAFFDPVGAVPAAGTSFESGVAIRIGAAGPRSFLTAGDIGGTGGLADPTISAGVNGSTSSFSSGDLDFDLTQSLTETFDGGIRTGSILTQTYVITNTGGSAVDFELLRYLDGDLFFDGSNTDGGGLLGSGGDEILFETDSATGSADDTTFVGIGATGGTLLGSNRYEIDSFSGLLGRILAGTALDDIVTGDGVDADEFIDAGAGYDVTLALRNAFSLAAGASTTYTTTTIFGSGAPESFTGPSADGTITTTAFGASTADSGDVTIRAGVDFEGIGEGSVDLQADVVTTGAPGRNGGDVLVTSKSTTAGAGSIATTNVNTDGTANGVNGNAGQIGLVTTGPGNDVTLRGQLSAVGGGGNVTMPGLDGTVSIVTTGALVDSDDTATDVLADSLQVQAMSGIAGNVGLDVDNERLEVDLRGVDLDFGGEGGGGTAVGGFAGTTVDGSIVVTDDDSTGLDRYAGLTVGTVANFVDGSLFTTVGVTVTGDGSGGGGSIDVEAAGGKLSVLEEVRTENTDNDDASVRLAGNALDPSLVSIDLSTSNADVITRPSAGNPNAGVEVVVDANGGRLNMEGGTSIETVADILLSVSDLSLAFGTGMDPIIRTTGAGGRIVVANDDGSRDTELGVGAAVDGSALGIDLFELNQLVTEFLFIGASATDLNESGDSVVDPTETDPLRPFLSETTGTITVVGDAMFDPGTGSSQVLFQTGTDVFVDGDVNMDAQTGGRFDIEAGRDVVLENTGTANPAITTGGTREVNITAGRSISMNAGSRIETVDGDIELEANVDGPRTAGTFNGITLNGSYILTGNGTPGGDIDLEGRGGDTGESNGVVIGNGSTVRSRSASSGAGTIEVEGEGSGDDGDGVVINGATVSSVAGAITVDGTSDANGGDGHGVELLGVTTISATGTGTVVVTGTANGQGLGDNVRVGGTSTIRTNMGDANVRGTNGVVRFLSGGVVESMAGDVGVDAASHVFLSIARAESGTVFVNADSPAGNGIADPDGTGAIVDNLVGDGLGLQNVVAPTAAFTAGSGIDVVTDVDVVAAENSTFADISIDNFGGGALLTIGAVGDLVGIVNSGVGSGDVSVTNHSPLSVQANIVAPNGTVFLGAPDGTDGIVFFGPTPTLPLGDSGFVIVSRLGVVNNVQARIDGVVIPQVSQFGDVTTSFVVGRPGETNLLAIVNWADGTFDVVLVERGGTTVTVTHNYPENPGPTPATPIPLRYSVLPASTLPGFSREALLAGVTVGGFPSVATSTLLDQGSPFGTPDRAMPVVVTVNGVTVTRFLAATSAGTDINELLGAAPIPGEGLNTFIYVFEKIFPKLEFPETVKSTFLDQARAYATLLAQEFILQIEGDDELDPEERQLLLQVLSNEEVARVLKQVVLPEDLIDSVMLFVQKLPDGRYRLLIREPGDETLRLLLEFRIKDGKLDDGSAGNQERPPLPVKDSGAPAMEESNEEEELEGDRGESESDMTVDPRSRNDEEERPVDEESVDVSTRSADRPMGRGERRLLASAALVGTGAAAARARAERERSADESLANLRRDGVSRAARLLRKRRPR